MSDPIPGQLHDLGLLTTRQAAAFLGVTPGYIDRLAHMEKLVPMKVGNQRFYQQGDLVQYRRDHPYLATRRGQP